MTIKLYCFGESGNAYKAALPLHLSGLNYEMVEVDFFGGETRSPEYRANINEMGEAPVMIDGDMRITQSGAIQQYISDKTGKFNGATEAERYDVLRWVLFDNHKLSSFAGMSRFLMNFLPEDKQPKEVIGFFQGRLAGTYGILNGALEGKDWLVGDGPTNADFSCCGYLFYPEPFGFERADWPNIDAWLSRIEGLEGYKAPYDLMPARNSANK